MAVVKWIFLLLAFGLNGLLGIQVNTGNETQLQTNNRTLMMTDLELSASERTRRLIPYMAFYVPASELPINQNYLLPRQKLPHQSNTNNNPNSPPPLQTAHLPIRSAYMHMKAPDATDNEYLAQAYHRHHQQQQQHHLNAPNPYHTLVFHDQPSEQAPKQPSKNMPAPIYQYLPPAPQQDAHSVLLPPAYVSSKHKAIQHIPPTTIATQYQQQQQQQQQKPIGASLQQQQPSIIYRERSKQSKLNLTPFTETNTLPGHFIPIIYNNENHNINDEDFQQKQQQARIKNGNVQKLPQKQIDATDYQQEQEPQFYLTITASPPMPLTGEQLPTQSSPYHANNEIISSRLQHHRQQHAKPPHTITAAKVQQQLAQQQYHINHHTQFQPTKSDNYFLQHQQLPHQSKHHNQPTPPPPSPPLVPSHYQHDQGPVQFLNSDSQDKYVMYLQQRVQPNKQQQQQQQQQQQHLHVSSPNQQQQQQYEQQQPQQEKEQHEEQGEDKQTIYYKEQRDHVAKQPYVKQHRFSQPIYVSSTPTTPPNDSPEDVHINYVQQPPHRHATYQPRPEIVLSPNHNHHQQHHGHQQISYSQAQTSQRQQQQQEQPEENENPKEEIFFKIPVRNMMENLATHHQHQHQYRQHSTPSAQAQAQAQPTRVNKEPSYHSSSISPKYIEYLIDEPKQSIDEEKPQHHEIVAATAKPQSTPQAAYILVTTAAPSYHGEQLHKPEHNQYNYGSTVRPVYKQQQQHQRKPSLRLRPVAPEIAGQYASPKTPNSNNLQPKPFKTTNDNNHNNHNDAKYAYVSTKPTYTQLLYTKPSLPIKLKPDHYAYITPNTLDDQTPKEDDSQAKYKTSTAQPPSAIYGDGGGIDLNEVAAAANQQLPDIRSSSLAEILHKLQASNHLPHTLTPDNIDNSIKTLITILNNLKETQTIVPYPPQHHEVPAINENNNNYDENYSTGGASGEEHQVVHGQQHVNSVLPPAASGPNKHPGPSTGRPGIDYPNYATIPQTSFDCHSQRYKGFFGDPETNCQVWHYCDLNGGKASFLCPNGTIFSQIALTCDWWFNVKCSTTAQLYVLNERLYKYILPFNPKFPEDYSGPLVDKYLAMKFQEMEEKMRAEKSKNGEAANEEKTSQNHLEDDEPAVAKQVDKLVPTQDNQLYTNNSYTEHSGQQEYVMKESSEVNEVNSERNSANDSDEVEGMAQHGSIDTYEMNSQQEQQQQQHQSMTATEMPPLSVKPIVVPSSTMATSYEDEMNEQHHQHHNHHQQHQHLHRHEEQSTSSSSIEELNEADREPIMNTHRPITKITVEKVEVIEIKPDGTTGQLTPLYARKSHSKMQ